MVWEVESGCGWEPLFDRYRLSEGDGVLSLYVVNGTDVGVLDLDLATEVRLLLCSRLCLKCNLAHCCPG